MQLEIQINSQAQHGEHHELDYSQQRPLVGHVNCRCLRITCSYWSCRMSTLTPSIEKLEQLRARTQHHWDQDMLLRETYGGDDGFGFKGCSVGCLAYEIDKKSIDNKVQHEAVSNYYQYPEWLVHLQDALFENADKEIHTNISKALKPRDNWRSVMHVIHWRILQEVTLPIAGESTEAVKEVIRLHQKEEPKDSAAWSDAEDAAISSARGGAYCTAWAAAYSADWAVAGSIAESVEFSASGNADWKIIMDIVLEEVSR